MIRAAPPGSLPIEIGRMLYFLVWSCSDVLAFVRSEQKLTFAESLTRFNPEFGGLENANP